MARSELCAPEMVNRVELAAMVGANCKYADLIMPELLQRGVMVREEGKAVLRRQKGAQETAVGDLHDPVGRVPPPRDFAT
jgi:hypothetical protein